MKVVKLFTIILIPLFIFACTYDSDIAYLNDQVVELNREIKKLQNSLDRKVGEELDERMKSIHSQQASMRVELDRVKTELTEINGRIEDNENLTRSFLDRDLKEKDEIKKTLIELTDRVANLERMVKYQYQYMGLRPPEGPQPMPPAYEAPQPEVQPPESKKEMTESQIYDMALNLYREGKYEDSISLFQEFIKRFPKSDRADNAYFWIGECYMALRQFSQAILSYDKVIKNYPKGNKVPNAMLRQAIAFIELKDFTPSKLLLKKIIKKYPNSPEAKIAEKKLQTLP